jgi:hypothetical protein
MDDIESTLSAAEKQAAAETKPAQQDEGAAYGAAFKIVVQNVETKQKIEQSVYPENQLHQLVSGIGADIGIQDSDKLIYGNARTHKQTRDGGLSLKEFDVQPHDCLTISGAGTVASGDRPQRMR